MDDGDDYRWDDLEDERRDRQVDDLVWDVLIPAGRHIRERDLFAAAEKIGISKRELMHSLSHLDYADQYGEGGFRRYQLRTGRGWWWTRRFRWPDPEHERVAIHEAGHAVIATVLRLSVDFVTIHADHECGFSGHCKQHEPRPAEWRIDHLEHAEIIMAFAGHLAENELLGYDGDMFGWHGDIRDVEWDEWFCTRPVDLNRLYRFAAQLVHRHRGLIHEVAARLLRQGTVSGAWVRNFIADCRSLD
jgi:hypothetical protein